VANLWASSRRVYAINAMDKYGLTIEEVDAASGGPGAFCDGTYGTSNLAGTDVLSTPVATTTRPPSRRNAANSGGCPVDPRHGGQGLLGREDRWQFLQREAHAVIDPPPSIQALQNLGRPAWPRPTRSPTRWQGSRSSSPLTTMLLSWLWDLLAATLVYSATACRDLRRHRQIDRSMRWGYAWDLGPFELGTPGSQGDGSAHCRPRPGCARVGDGAGGHRFAFLLQKDTDGSSLGPGQKRHKLLPARARTIVLADLKAAGKTLDENEYASRWIWATRIACIEFRTRPTRSATVCSSSSRRPSAGGDAYDALVIGNQGLHFSAGADLKMMLDKIAARGLDGNRLPYPHRSTGEHGHEVRRVPIVAAPFGRVFGGRPRGGLHCHRVQADADVAMVWSRPGWACAAAGGMKEAVVRNDGPRPRRSAGRTSS